MVLDILPQPVSVPIGGDVNYYGLYCTCRIQYRRVPSVLRRITVKPA